MVDRCKKESALGPRKSAQNLFFERYQLNGVFGMCFAASATIATADVRRLGGYRVAMRASNDEASNSGRHWKAPSAKIAPNTAWLAVLVK
jgi:hypothetical protein